MPATLETHGDIEVKCDTDHLQPNRMAKLVFRAYDDAPPPFQILVRAPSGKIILKRVLRVLPTGQPQSPPAVAFSVVAGEYQITISELKGTAEGKATLLIS